MNDASNDENKNFSDAIINEISRFQEYYIWIKMHMPSSLFKELDNEKVSLIAHNLIGFHMQGYFSPISFEDMSITLCLNSSYADLKVLKYFSMFGIKHYHCYVSDNCLPGVNKELRIAIVKFTRVNVENSKGSFSEDEKKKIWDTVTFYDKNVGIEIFDIIVRDITKHFLHSISENNLRSALHMFLRATTRDNCQYEVRYNKDWKKDCGASLDIIFAWRNVSKYSFLYHIAQMVARHSLSMKNVNATYIDPHGKHNVLIMVIGLHGIGDNASWDVADIEDLLQELVTIKYFCRHDVVYHTLVEPSIIRGNMSNFLRSTISFIHQNLVELDANLYEYANIEEAICRHPELAKLLCEAFECKFHPKIHDMRKYDDIKNEFFSLVEKLDTGNEVNDTKRRNVLFQGMNLVEHTLKTNFYRSNKSSIAFRLDPNYLNKVPVERKRIFPTLPYAIIFVKGMSFFGFHIRFKDLSRGGIRTIFPGDIEKTVAARNFVFKECYNLAYTQHKKNKDIPEGGAKGVIFLEPYVLLENEKAIFRNELQVTNLNADEVKKMLKTFVENHKREFMLYTQRSFVDSLITIVNTNEDGKVASKNIVDYLQKPEYIYVGPDENMSQEIISWIANHSYRCGYKPGKSFISSKPDFGINHKKYGVTSLGVNVYMEEILKYININPSDEEFSVKISGGPDGDVAGNQILNLYKYYPKTAKLLAITDISGTIYDPKGLNLEELAKLFHNRKSINSYPANELNENGFLLDVNIQKTHSTYQVKTLLLKKENNRLVEEWLSGSDMNHLLKMNLHKVVCDVFIPAGGRPRTLNSKNCEDFIDEGGRPTAKAIVEGANLYITDKARKIFEELGVLIIKDSSANKAGVTSSSFEVLCGLALSDGEFSRDKEEIVKDILDILRDKALKEANILITNHRDFGTPLTESSDNISHKINEFTDQLLEYLGKLPSNDKLDDTLIGCFLEYCPQTLRNKYKKQLLENVPLEHKKAIIASFIASKVVYERNVQWNPSIVDILPLIFQSK